MENQTDQFVGTWIIKEWTVTNLSTNEVIPFFGGNFSGQIIYTADGWVSASLMEKNRPDVSNDRDRRYHIHSKLKADGLATLSEEALDFLSPYTLSALGYVGYMGTYDTDEELVNHHIQSASRPNHVGITLPRYYRFDDNLLYLHADAFGWRDSLVWEKANDTDGQ